MSTQLKLVPDRRTHERRETNNVRVDRGLYDPGARCFYSIELLDVSLTGLGFRTNVDLKLGGGFRLFLGDRSWSVELRHKRKDGEGFRYGLLVSKGTVDLIGVLYLMGCISKVSGGYVNADRTDLVISLQV